MGGEVSSMVTKTAVIRNRDGIHVRPSTEIIKAAQGYQGVVTLESKGITGDLSVMGLLMLGLTEGERVQIMVEGADELAMAKKLKKLFEKEWDFPRQ